MKSKVLVVEDEELMRSILRVTGILFFLRRFDTLLGRNRIDVRRVGYRVRNLLVNRIRLLSVSSGQKKRGNQKS